MIDNLCIHIVMLAALVFVGMRLIDGFPAGRHTQGFQRIRNTLHATCIVLIAVSLGLISATVIRCLLHCVK